MSEDKKPKGVQEKIEHFLDWFFGGWGALVARNPCKVFWLSLLVFIGLSGGMSQRAGFEDEQTIWSPRNNPSVLSMAKVKEMFPSQGSFISLMVEGKGEQNLLTKAAFTELNKFIEEVKTFKTDVMTLDDICVKVRNQCMINSPLAFAMDQTGAVNIEQFSNDAALVAQVQKGQAGGRVVELSNLFGDTTPASITQDKSTGANDIEKVDLMQVFMAYQNNDYEKEELQEFEDLVIDLAMKYSKESKDIDVYAFSPYVLQQAFSSDIQDDLALVQISISFVAVYCIFFMGSCSPIHFRSAAAGITLLAVMLSYAASSGFCFLVGGKVAGIHNLLPFLLIGIGVDDMFVIASCIDQTDPTQSAEKRMRSGMSHAGSSITITTVTNAMAFFLGCTSSLDALSSFCFFAGMGVIFLYIASCTIFASYMVWDIKRQMAQKGDCCGACCCHEDNIMCCKSACLTQKQKSYPFRGFESDISQASQQKEEQYASNVQKFLHLHFSKMTLSQPGIITILILYLIMIAVSIYGILNVEIDFKTTYFIGADAYAKNYININEEHFKAGSTLTFYTDNENNLDYTSKDSQEQLIKFTDELKKSKWLVKDTLSSWFLDFRKYAESVNGEEKVTLLGPPTPVDNECKDSYSNGIVEPTKMMACLKQFLQTPQGVSHEKDIIFDMDKTKIKGFRQTIKLILIESASNEGVDALMDLRKLQTESGLSKTFSFTQDYLDYESYVTFDQETILTVTLALIAIFVVLILVTANLTVTMFVLICVALVDLFLLALLYFWDVTLNSVTIVNVTIAIGLAVDYSAHIGHAYLTINPPEVDEKGDPLTNHQKRVYKARGALGQMGSSVFHGAFSTFLAICVLAPSASYIFEVFFKMWFGIIIFGVMNGFILLPVLLALCGPLNRVQGQDAHEGQMSDPEMAKKSQVGTHKSNEVEMGNTGQKMME